MQKRSRELILRYARKRKEVFQNLGKYLKRIKEIVQEIDPEAEVYLFGSVAEGKHTLSSDIDILVITNKPAPTIITELWKNNIEYPFEIHVYPPQYIEIFRKRTKLIKI